MEETNSEQLEAEPDDELLDDGDGHSAAAWSSVWQLPMLIAGVALLVLGVLLAMPPRPDDDFPAALDGVEQYFKANNLDKAEQRLREIGGHIERAGAASRARLELLRGDLIYIRTNDAGWEAPDALRQILFHYGRGRELGHDFDRDTPRLRRWARVLIAQGRTKDALKMLDRLASGPAQHRYAIVRQVLERLRAQRPPAAPDQISPVVTRFLEELRNEPDEAARRRQEIWGVSLAAQLYLESGEPGQVIDYLNPRRATLTSRGGDDDLAPLIVLAAQAHQQLGDFEQAQREYGLAQLKLADDRSNPLHAEVLVGLAHIALVQDNDLQAALEHYSSAVQIYPTTPAFIDALIGQADCEARLGTHSRAREHFHQAIELLMSDPHRAHEKIRALTEAIFAHHQLHFDAASYDLALDYLKLLPPLFAAQLPPDLVVQFARTHEQIAEQRLASAASMAETDEMTPGRRMASREAGVHFEVAGDDYRRHAHLVTIIDDAAHGASLWSAAACYDRAQLWQQAISVYAEFRETRQGDPRQLEVTRKLALAYMADGQNRVAADLLRKLIDEHPRNRQAHAGRVPLARSLIKLGEPNAALAELSAVVSDHEAITPDSAEFRDALIEMGKLYYRMGKYELAIGRMEEVADRYGSELGGVLHAYLANAYRRSIEQIDEEIDESLAQSRRESLAAERIRRLQRAGDTYTQAINVLESRDPRILSPFDQVLLRNSYFYRGDCAYDLGRYTQAIEWYDQAAKRWELHPATLVARMQIVNAYCALEQFQDAKVALDRAQYAFKRIPQDAFDDPNLPITRKHWEDWFNWTSQLGLFQQANAQTLE